MMDINIFLVEKKVKSDQFCENNQVLQKSIFIYQNRIVLKFSFIYLEKEKKIL